MARARGQEEEGNGHDVPWFLLCDFSYVLSCLRSVRNGPVIRGWVQDRVVGWSHCGDASTVAGENGLEVDPWTKTPWVRTQNPEWGEGWRDAETKRDRDTERQRYAERDRDKDTQRDGDRETETQRQRGQRWEDWQEEELTWLIEAREIQTYDETEMERLGHRGR